MSICRFLLLCLLLSPTAVAQTPALGFGSFNSLCAPPPCALSSATLQRGLPITLYTAGGMGGSYYLLLSAWPVTCVPLPGLAGQFASGNLLAIEALPLSWARVYIYGGNPCFAWLGSATLPVPLQLVPGTQLVAQLLNVSSLAPLGAFSNAVTLTVQ